MLLCLKNRCYLTKQQTAAYPKIYQEKTVTWSHFKSLSAIPILIESEDRDLCASTRGPAKCMADWKRDCCLLCMQLLKACGILDDKHQSAPACLIFGRARCCLLKLISLILNSLQMRSSCLRIDRDTLAWVEMAASGAGVRAELQTPSRNISGVCVLWYELSCHFLRD